ncbi:MAG: DUF433 domain-containing protein [Bacteroidota bacterium]
MTVEDEICNGNPTIRGLRITVQTVLEFLLNGTPEEEILHQHPVLDKVDLAACKKFALELMGNHYTLKGAA